MRWFTTFGFITVLACRTDKSITIQNPAPKADIFSHSNGDVVLEGFSTTFVGTVTDANHTPDQLRTIWYLDGEIVCDDVIPDEDGQTQCDISLDTDNSEITLAVLDAENARGETAILVSVEPTEAPIAEIASPLEDSVYYSDQLIEFEGQVSDAEDDEELLTVRWESNLDGVLDDVSSTPNNSGQVVGFGSLSEGSHAIQLFVTDTTGKESQDSVIITVGPTNSAPTCGIQSPVDGTAGPEGNTVTFEAVADDVDIAENLLSVEWLSDKDGVLGSSTVNTDGSIVFPISSLSVNAHVVTLTVTDELGESCTDSIVYTVGTPPNITINTPNSGDVFGDGTPIEFNATVSDNQDQATNITLEWVVNGNVISTQGATSTGDAIFTYGALSYGTYNLLVTATDSDGLTDSDQVNFTINGTPTTPGISIHPVSPLTGDSLNVTIDIPSTDPEGLQVTYMYEWLLGGQVQPLYTSSVLPSSATQKGEQWSVNVTPSDGVVSGQPGTDTIIVQNTSPTLGTLSISPTGTVYNDDVLTCLGIASDPDEIPTVSYEWSIGGSVVGTSSTLDVSSTGSMPGDTLVCTATATDGDGATDSNSASVSLGNRNPSISASISTNGTNQNAELTCIGTATDPDGESPTVTYEWFNGSNSLGSSNPLQLNSTLASSGDVIDCTATATDAMGGADSVIVSQMITNTAPVISAVNITPNPAVQGDDDLTCTVSASDVDNDSLLYTYVWSDSTGVQQTTTLVSDTTDVFLAGGTTEDTWTCEVTPFDGADYGLSDSDSVLVESGCVIGEFDCPGTSCENVLNNGGSVGDGVYWIDPDNAGAFDIYCDMANGGWSLLLSADGNSTYWGNNSPNWWDVGLDSALNGLSNTDNHSPAYDRLQTDEVRLCLENSTTCHVFNHQYGISLQDFFTTNTTYTEFSYNSVGHNNVGSFSSVTNFESNMGHSVAYYSCQWLGINDQNSISAIGFLADGNAGCMNNVGTYTHHDDTALGVGLQSCLDSNNCYKGGSGHLAGQQRAVDGIEDVVLGPWFVFGR